MRPAQHASYGSCTTPKPSQSTARAHDLESAAGGLRAAGAPDNSPAVSLQVYASHWGHAALVCLWLAGNLFHLGWGANYELWARNPLGVRALAHAARDPHGFTWALRSCCGLYNAFYTVGLWKLGQVCGAGLGCLAAAALALLLGAASQAAHRDFLASAGCGGFQGARGGLAGSSSLGPARLAPCHTSPHFHAAAPGKPSLRSSRHAGCVLGFGSAAWAGHLLPRSGSLSFRAGLRAETGALFLGDLAHHHLAVGALALWAGQLGRVFSASARAAPGGGPGSPAAPSSYPPAPLARSARSLHLQLSAALAGLHLMPSLASQQGAALSPYLYLSYDHASALALFLHHSWVASLAAVGSFAHAAVALARDAKTSAASGAAGAGPSLTSTLSWVSAWLGFHCLGLSLHNDTAVAFGCPQHQVLVEPVAAMLVQEASGASCCGFSAAARAAGPVALPAAPLGPADFLAHHAVALGLHASVLVLLKACLDARGSGLARDKIHHLYAFACEGPGRGGTCDISAWDSFYLASFWMLNLNAWASFYFHWKHLSLWQSASAQFLEAATRLVGWFRDYLWFHSAALVNAYSGAQLSDVAAYEFLFLAAHLTWATGFMFLTSWRGYWQELVDSLLSLHLKAAAACELWTGALAPAALSIVQARRAGLLHFGAGFLATYAAFSVGATS